MKCGCDSGITTNHISTLDAIKSWMKIETWLMDKQLASYTKMVLKTEQSVKYIKNFQIQNEPSSVSNFEIEREKRLWGKQGDLTVVKSSFSILLQAK